MDYIKKSYNSIYDYYRDINSASLSGAIDVIVVQQKDGTFRSSPFHVRFGKGGVFIPKNKVVEIEINGELVDLTMKLGEAGAAYFEELKSNFEEDQMRFHSDLVSKHSHSDNLSKSSSKPSLISSEPIKIETNSNANKIMEASQVRSEGAISSIPPTIKITNSLDESRLINNYESPTKNNNNNTTTEKDESSSNTNTNLPHSIQLGNLIISDCVNLSNESKNSDTLSCLTSASNGSYYSDGEYTPELRSPVISRPPTPKSDTEIDKIKGSEDKENAQNNKQWKWGWGQLPEPAEQNKQLSASVSSEQLATISTTTSPNVPAGNDNGKGLVMTTVALPSPTSSPKAKQEKQKFLSGIFKKTEQPVDGLFLDDAAKLDAEVADSYFNQKNSLRPISHLMSMKEDDQDSAVGSPATQSPLRDYSILGDVQMSLCGLGNPAEQHTTKYDELFNNHMVSYERFLLEFNSIVSNPNLVFKINNHYYSGIYGMKNILSVVLYHKPLNENNDINSESNGPITTVKTVTAPTIASPSAVVSQSTSSATTLTVTNQKPVAQTKSRNWLSSFLKRDESQKSTVTSSTISTASDVHVININENQETVSEIKAVEVSVKDEKDNILTQPSQETRQSLPEDKYINTTRLSSKSLAKLKLKPGLNEIVYSITTMMQGTTRIESLIFLWNYDDKIVVSDIDGTITRSDALGQILPLMNFDWSQAGVADLFTAIEKNSYKFMYLSARAIGQTSLTRNMLRKINQGGAQLPEGPLLVNPVSLFRAFHKEVIEKRPQDFKIKCLNDIKSLFPGDHNPFYAGYGNRTNDVEAYRAVSIAQSRIFTINPKGELKHEASQTLQLSYGALRDYVEQIFPPPIKSSIDNEFSSFFYWKDPLPQLEESEPSKLDEEILF